MTYEPATEFRRLHNPWEKFSQRLVERHLAEDESRLCPPQVPISTSEVVARFLSHGYTRLDEAIPRKRQLLRNFLEETITPQQMGMPNSVEHDIRDGSVSGDIALLDDRQKHERCAKSIGQLCSVCRIFSRKLSIPELYQRLQEKVSLCYIP
jgi:hypothetical protein